MGRKSKFYTGQVLDTVFGPVEVLEYINHKEIVCKFYKTENRVSEEIKTVPNYILHAGRLRSNYDLCIYGVGYYGKGIYKTGKPSPAFRTWSNMLKRCYCEKALVQNSLYENVFVDDEWKCFQNFAKWFWEESNYKKGFVLDKDLISNTRIYSKETCVFIPEEINIAIVLHYKNKEDSSLPVGVTKCSTTNKYCVSAGTRSNVKWGGRFRTPDEAFDKYCEIKQKQISELAQKHSDSLTKESIEKLENFVTERILTKYA